jgi:beta-lactamase regulating signal transducer with metallopeptidase domain
MNSFLDLGLRPSALETWHALAIEGILRATLGIAVAVLVSAALGRASASLRHLVWASGLAGLLAMPLLMLALPSWQVPILPRAPTPVQTTPTIRDTTPPSAPGPDETEMHASGAVSASALGKRRVGPGRTDMRPDVERAPSGSSAGMNRAFWLTAVWCAGAVIVCLPMLIGLARLRQIRWRAARWSEAPLGELADRLSGRLRGLRRVVMLRGGDTISPITWGVLRPVILLPAGAETWPHERLRAVLLHELAHVARCDCLSQLLARLTCAIYWFHPLVWMAAHRLRIESERACDDLVLQSGARATDYATHLLDVARGSRATRGLAGVAVPMARPLQLEGRLRAILDPSQSRRVVTRRGACLLFAAAAAVWLPLSVARLGARAENAAAKGAARERARPARAARMTVAGRVLDPDGRLVPGAKVAILARRKLAALNARSEDQHVKLGRAEAGTDGTFRLDVPRTSSLTHYELYALASRPGFGLGWAEMNRDAETPTADVRLKPEQIIEGRLVDLQGVPAAGVTARAASLGVAKRNGGRYDGIHLSKGPLPGLEDVWPGPIVSDGEGQFRLASIGRGVNVGLQVDDPRFARQDLGIQTDDQEGPKRTTLAVQPAMHISGRVTCADTGAPLANAIVVVGAGPNMFSSSHDEYRTDANGHYDANPAAGKYVRVTVYPPIGSPYLIFERNFTGDDRAARRDINLEVPRGVVLTGRITERGSGRPLAGASIFYENGRSNVVEGQGTIPGWMSAIASGPDGRYAIAVTPGKGQLLVYAATADFVHEMKGDREIFNGQPGGPRCYAHAFVPYAVKNGQAPAEVDVALQPGITLAGRVVGPAGQTVDTAEIITTLSISPFHTIWRGDFTIPVRDGHFELHGVAPDRPYQCSVIDIKNGWGTTLEVIAALAAEGPLTVKLQPCGSAQARLVDEEGRPVSKGTLLLNLVGTPGPGTDFGGDSLTDAERNMLAADEVIYVNVDRQNYGNGPRADRAGHLTLPMLIPGTTYRIYEYTRGQSGHAHRWRDFTVEAGRTTDLGDVRVKAVGR